MNWSYTSSPPWRLHGDGGTGLLHFLFNNGSYCGLLRGWTYVNRKHCQKNRYVRFIRRIFKGMVKKVRIRCSVNVTAN
jgi:hypothetical protein